MITQTVAKRYLDVEKLKTLLETKFPGVKCSVKIRNGQVVLTVPAILTDVCRQLLTHDVISNRTSRQNWNRARLNRAQAEAWCDTTVRSLPCAT